jgi:hypothetical protein
VGGRRGGVEGSRAADWVEDVERAAGGVAAAVRVAVPCSAALVVVVSFVSAVVGVLLVVPVAVAAWSVVAGGETKAVWSVVTGVSRSPAPPCTPRTTQSSTCGRVRPHAGQRRCCTWKFGLRPGLRGGTPVPAWWSGLTVE